MFKKALLALALVVATTGASYAQTVAAQSVVGYYATSGTNCTLGPCFVPYGATVPVSGSISASNPSVGTNAVTAPTSSTQIGTVDGSGNLQPASSTNPLPTTVVGGATSTLQTTGNSSLATIATNTTNAGTPVTTPSATVGLSTQACTVACASTVVSGAHSLYDAEFSATVTGWLFLYDATSCAANGTVTPKKAIAYTVANATLGLSWGSIGIPSSTGIALCFSSSGPYTATASTTAYISVDYK